MLEKHKRVRSSRDMYESRVRSRRLNENEYIKSISSMKVDDDLLDIKSSIISIKEQIDQDFRYFSKKMVNFLSDPVSYVGGDVHDVQYKLDKIEKAIYNLSYALEDLTNL